MAFHIVEGNIIDYTTDAIVNAANKFLLGGSGVCGAIFKKAGWIPLQIECLKKFGCKAGEAVLTKGYKLSANYIIHTVGPVWKNGQAGEEEILRNCYRNSLKLAVENNLKSIAFPLISTGVYGYPKEQAMQIAIEEINGFLETYQGMLEVYLVLYNKKKRGM